MAVQIEARTGPWAAGPVGTSTGLPRAAMSSTGTSMRSSRVLVWPASTMVTGRWRTPAAAASAAASSLRTMVSAVGGAGDFASDDRFAARATLPAFPVAGLPAAGRATAGLPAAGASGRRATPPRKRATSSSGRCVADSPTRCRGRSPSGLASASSRSSERARWAPRLLGTRAWISSTMTVSTARRRSRAFEVSSRYSDSGVVIRMSAASRPNSSRSRAGVSPVRTATAGIRCSIPSSAASRVMPAMGARRFRSTSTASAFSGET